MATTVSYKGNEIANFESGTKTLKTSCKYCEGDITIQSTGGITPSGSINITENGTYDVTHFETANVKVAGVKTEVLTQTLTQNQNDITFILTKDEIPKAVILESLTAPENRVWGEIYYASCFDRGGLGEGLNFATGRISQGAYVKKESVTGLYNVVTISAEQVFFNRIISNSLFPANTTYQLTCYYWD